MLKKNLLRLLFLLILPLSVLAQDTIPYDSSFTPPPTRSRPKFSSRLFGGGDLGLQFGTFTVINLAPVIGYKATEKLGIGVGPIYTYVNDKTYSPAYETSMFGGRVFGQYKATENILLYSEYQVVNAEVLDDFTYKPIRRDIPVWFVGGGYVSPIGRNSAFMLMVLFDLIEDPYSYYQNPTFRVGFSTGF